MSSSQPSITLFRGFPSDARYTWSPFVNKLEARLRFGGLSYRRDEGSPVKAPRGKIPYVHLKTEGEPDTVLGDSKFIADTLVDAGVLLDLNSKLGPVEKAIDLSVRALLEEKVYWYGGYERWVQNYYTMRDGVLGAIPYPVRVLVGLLAYRNMSSTLHGQGTGRYSVEEIAALRQEAWNGINELVIDARKAGSKNGAYQVFWLLKGEEPTDVDSTLYGFITSSLVCSAAPKGAELIRTYPAVLDYARRIHKRYFPEYTFWDE